jgi:hypothetical protein
VLAQNRMKKQANQGHSKRQFAKGEKVFLHMQPYKHTSLKDEHFQKINPKFYGPYAIINRLRPVVNVSWKPAQET